MSQTHDSVIRGELVLPDRILADGWVAVSAGRIAGIGEGEPPAAHVVADHRGDLVLPGLVDGHMHTGSAVGFPGIEGATMSAAAGGVTTCVDMPYDVPRAVTDAAIFREKVEWVERLAHVDIALYGTIRKRGGVEAIPALAEAGACSFKLSTYEYDENRFPRIDHITMVEAFREIAKTGLMVSIHNEDQEMVEFLTAQAKAEGRTDPIMHCRTRPPLAESMADGEIFEIGLETGAHVHMAHSSIARGFRMAEDFRRAGGKATGEACLQYLCMTEEDLVRLEGFGKSIANWRYDVQHPYYLDGLRQALKQSGDQAPVEGAAELSAYWVDQATGMLCRCRPDFWRGEPGTLGEFATRLTGSADLYEGDGRSPGASVNFVTAHDGFTLRDLVSYNEKHNEANGEDNNDGDAHNRSWNCGVEGETDDPEVVTLRARQRRNFLATLLISQGVPMISHGDELGRTQGGNNNVYCQDNEISWIDWSAMDDSLVAFTRDLIALRRDHAVFRRRHHFDGRPAARDIEAPLPDIVWLEPDATAKTEDDWGAEARSIGFYLNGHMLTRGDEEGEEPYRDFYVLMNAWWEPVPYTLPGPTFPAEWEVVVDTSSHVAPSGSHPRVRAGDVLEVQARSTVVLRQVPEGA